MAFNDRIRKSLPPKSKRAQLGNMLSLLSGLKPEGTTDIAACLDQMAAMLKHRSLLMVFSDLLVDTPPLLRALHRLRHAGHDLILFHVLDEAEVSFPFDGLCQLKDMETGEKLQVDGRGFRHEYTEQVEQYRTQLRTDCQQSGIDYVPLDTSMQFDKALMEYLLNRRSRF